ncbi:XdhC family protein [Nibricoccus aquaticus]|nr:XdhC family protein [Nibricoccus aquaticus]
MKELLSITASLRADPSPAVLCTLVGVTGSSFRTIGARMLWRPDGSYIGSISGGCLEADLMTQAADVLRTSRPRIARYNTAADTDIIWGTGSGCEGTIAVWLEPIAGVPPWLDFILAAWDRRENAALFTECFPHHTPTGAVAARASSGLSWTHPDHKDPFASERLLPDALERQTSTEMLAHRDHGFFCEFLPPPPSLTLFGAGDDTQSLTYLATELGWRVTIVDSRASLLNTTRFPSAHALHLAPPETALASLPLDARSFVVLMTHRYLDDLPLLRALLPRPLAYLGLLGSRKRSEKILADLTREGLAITDDMHARLHAPVGLDLGGGTPEEVALSILAELQASHSSRDARPLRQRLLPIHRDQGRLESLVSAPPRFAAIILAAGASTRLGQPKQLLLHKGTPLIVRAAQAALDAKALPVIVVLGAHADKIRPALAGLPVFIVENPNWAEGMGTSITTGFSALHGGVSTFGSVLLAVCDQPHLSATAIEKLRAALDGRHTIAATRHGDTGGVPAIFTHSHFPTLRQLRGAEGARRIIAAHKSNTALVDLPELALDIDTPADWQQLNSP